jgi:hypothetical protein
MVFVLGKGQRRPAQLGASYYLAVINVPAMVVVHVMIFVYLLVRCVGSGRAE